MNISKESNYLICKLTTNKSYSNKSQQVQNLTPQKKTKKWIFLEWQNKNLNKLEEYKQCRAVIMVGYR